MTVMMITVMVVMSLGYQTFIEVFGSPRLRSSDLQRPQVLAPLPPAHTGPMSLLMPMPPAVLSGEPAPLVDTIPKATATGSEMGGPASENESQPQASFLILILEKITFSSVLGLDSKGCETRAMAAINPSVKPTGREMYANNQKKLHPGDLL